MELNCSSVCCYFPVAVNVAGNDINGAATGADGRDWCFDYHCHFLYSKGAFVSREDSALCRFPFLWGRNPAFLLTWEIKILSIEEN